MCVRINQLTYDLASYPWDEAAKIMKKREVQNETILKQIRDSIVNNYTNKGAKEYFESVQIEPDLIRMIGLLDMKECIPVLKQKLTHCVESGCLYGQEKAYRYALARLGDKEQRQYILDNLMDIDVFRKEDLAYFRDDEMTWKYIEVNYSSGKSVPFDSYSGYYSVSLAIISNIYSYIKNLPTELTHSDLFENMQEEYDWAKAVYDWLEINKATIEFDYDGEKEYPLWHT